MLYEYKGNLYPEYIRDGNMTRWIEPFAKRFCVGDGLDVGPGRWKLEGAEGIEKTNWVSADSLPDYRWDYIYSSHCLEHLVNPVKTLEHWKSRLKKDGVIFLYLPHPDMEYWRPQNCRKHLHIWEPSEMAKILTDLGFVNVIHSERDLAWSYACVGWNG